MDVLLKLEEAQAAFPTKADNLRYNLRMAI